MGFRDLQFFNGALLAKQGWKILKHPELMSTAILHIILKSKYFPHFSLLEAKILANCSYTWRSIAQTRDVI
jgi:hypothetical protein